MIDTTELETLVRQHGHVKEFTIREGGMWLTTRMGDFRAARVHAIRFQNGVEWDEINRIRPNTHSEENCPGHVAAKWDKMICHYCGIHVNSLRPDEEEPY